MLNFLPMERLLFAEESGDGASSGGGAAVADDGGDYDYGDEGEVDLFANESDDETVGGGESAEVGDQDDEESPEGAGEADEADGADDSGEAAESADEFEESLLNRAAAVGYNFNDVKQFGSNASLKIAVERSEALARSILEQQQRQAANPAQSGQQQSRPSEYEQFHAAQKEKIEQLAAEGYGDEAVAVMHQQNDMALRQAQIIESLQQQSRNTQTEASIAAQQAAEVQFERSMDGYLESLGDEYSSLFGKGASATMSQGTQEFANRARVFQVASGLKELAQQKGWDVPSDSRAFEMAVNAEFGSRVKELARKEIKSKLRKSSQSVTSRPSQSAGRALTGEERAAERVTTFFKANASHDDASDGFDDEI
jgi:hypothetical protein